MSLSISQQQLQTKPAAATTPWFATLALTGLISTIVLIMVGSIVRVTGSGLGCPDWPLCYGQAIPPLKVSAWVEFSHRLLGGAVALQVVGLIVLAWRRYRPEPWIFRTAVLAGVTLVAQVLLGGIHVIYELPRWTGWVHTGVAMMLAGLLAVWVAVTRPALRRLGARTAGLPGVNGGHRPRLALWTTVTAGATYVLLLTGSLVTRTGASLACPGFPACGLEVVPANLRPLVTVQMLHRYAAFTVALAIGLTLWQLLRVSRGDRGVRNVALALIALLVLQLGLGITNVWFAIPMWSRVLHLGMGATIWALMVMLSVTLHYGRRHAPA